MYYFDYAATTKMSNEVFNTLIKTNDNYYAHPDNDNLSLNVEELCKKTILESMNISNYDLIFTPSGTIANNLAINSISGLYNSKKHFITTYYEHSSMYNTFKELERLGHKVDYIYPNSDGVIEIPEVVKLIKPNTVCISIMHVNNELGSINDIESIFKAVKEINSNIITISDMIQSISKVKFPSFKYIDICTISAHKIYGPKGIGAIIYNDQLKLKNTKEYTNFDLVLKGTQPLYNKVAFAKAIDLVFKNYDLNLNILKELITYFKNKLNETDISYNIVTNTNIFSIRINSEMQGESLVNHFYKNNFKISSRSSCSTKDKSVSRSLSSIGLSKDQISKTIRISISYKTKYDDMDKLIEFIKTIN